MTDMPPTPGPDDADAEEHDGISDSTEVPTVPAGPEDAAIDPNQPMNPA